MATKRQAPSDSDARPQPAKRSKPSTPYQHQQRPAHHGKKSFKKAHPVNELKSTVRSLRRLLTRSDDLPANIRVEKERALQTAERDLKEAEKAKKRSDMIGKYHKIRFFERQKAERRLKKAKKALREAEESGDGDVEELRARVEEVEVELNYAMYYPLEKEYVSLFPTRRGKDGEVEEVVKDGERQGDAEMLEVVRKCMKEGTLNDLREGRLSDKGERVKDEEEEEEVARPTKKKAAKPAKSKRAQDEEEEGGDDDETGGGFFE
ncbi:hypothetical protein PRZ48_001354 [Zasmidium cellare]|uniref:rRNA-processing protein EFG1 n=1 Tax=Zasmidium cellare TaxID=395010 RepID=A0ABR0F113_ZASCE|nr:hypothetical protein PRZ48_001354 [Zasmidium cellare]